MTKRKESKGYAGCAYQCVDYSLGTSSPDYRERLARGEFFSRLTGWNQHEARQYKVMTYGEVFGVDYKTPRPNRITVAVGGKK